MLKRVIGRIEVYLWCRHSDIGIEHRDIRFPLRIKVNSRNIIKASYSLLYSSKQNLPNSLFVLKLYLGLCRMNIHIDILCRYIEIKEVRNLLPLWDKSVESRDDCLMKIRMFHIAVVDEEILMGCFLTCRLWLTNKAVDMTKTRVNVYRQKILIESLTKYLHDSLTIATSTQTKKFCTIAVQRERYLWINQYDALKGGNDIIEFGSIRL